MEKCSHASRIGTICFVGSPLPTNYNNFVGEQNGYGHDRNQGGQHVTPEKVQGHACPTEASSYQGTTDIRSADIGREIRAKDVPEPEELT